MPLLFSYGTLQEPDVQVSMFGRTLRGTRDDLVAYDLQSHTVRDAAFVKLTGKSVHANAVYSGRDESRVGGTAFEVSEDELSQCDEYERPAGYARVAATLASGRETWVYVHTHPSE